MTVNMKYIGYVYHQKIKYFVLNETNQHFNSSSALVTSISGVSLQSKWKSMLESNHFLNFVTVLNHIEGFEIYSGTLVKKVQYPHNFSKFAR